MHSFNTAVTRPNKIYLPAQLEADEDDLVAIFFRDGACCPVTSQHLS